MVCMYCGGSTRVINSRSQKRLNQVWRRRRCDTCGSIWTTHETIDLSSSLMVQKTVDGQKKPLLQPFLKEVLLVSIYDCLKHRADAATSAAYIASTVASTIVDRTRQGVVARDELVALTGEVLVRYDQTGAAVYKAFHV